MEPAKLAHVIREKIQAAENEAAFIVVDDVKRFTRAISAKVDPSSKALEVFGLKVRENAFMLFGTYALVRRDGTAISIHKYV